MKKSKELMVFKRIIQKGSEQEYSPSSENVVVRSVDKKLLNMIFESYGGRKVETVKAQEGGEKKSIK